ncbi:hypothetical protein E1B28_004933 [Marasmius oreades]|uniref:Uncharacterized protein n=1 Tax=Marasmius oreades TaxID=181124 RepID=A0A9P7UZN9_9AGAR|nr:uncharacterized protein E1B28_004933 [Marasmius oreades]KAG7097597.1 hypothetical protein E1B28_004933 [Marasmius oreades]
MLDDSHPLISEIDSLRSAVARFQDEAHNASVKLQRFSFDTSNTQDRIGSLERENEILRKELVTLRTNPHPDSTPESHPAAQRSRELTLTLRKLSEKLTLTEDALQTRTTELTHASSEVAKSRASAELAYALAAQIRGREEEGKVRERELERKVMEAKEETKMSDLVVKEYADLVRSLEGRRADAGAPSSARTMVDSLSEGKLGLQRLFNDFSAESEKLQAEVTRLQGQLAEAESRCEVERKGAEADRVVLARTTHELEKLRLEDKTASKMVSRYMRFSQVSTNALQVSVNTLKTRHSATIDTLTSQIADISRQLYASEAAEGKLRTTLDELGKDIMREAFGRRREIALRLRLVSREQVLNDGLERLVRRLNEAFERQKLDADTLKRVLEDSRALLASVSGSDEITSEMGSLARIVAAESAVHGLIEELRVEKEKRIFLETPLPMHETLPQNGSANGHIDHNEVQDKSLPQTPPDENGLDVQNSGSSSLAASPVLSSAPNEPSLPVEVSLCEERPRTLDPASDASVASTTSDVAMPTLGSQVEGESHASAFPLEEAELPISNTTMVVRQNVDTQSPRGFEALTTPPQLTSVPNIPVTSLSPPHSENITSADADRDLSQPVLNPSIITGEPTSLTEMEALPIIEEPHPLLAELQKVGKRYDDLQRSFRDCHLALQDLRKQKSGMLPEHLFHVTVDRLDDFAEDARVELEIRVADEALMMQGYETMLSLPSAVSTLPVHTRTASGESIATTPTLHELEMQIQAFISGSDPVVHKARHNSEHKLADVQHDIAKLKLAIHEPPNSGELQSELAEHPLLSSHSPSQNSGGWASWLSSSTSSRSSSPGPAPTFGNVMTTPRLRHASSINRLKQQVSSPSRDANHDYNPFSSLGLKIAMPSINNSGSTISGNPAISFPSQNSSSPMTSHRIRTVSMLGLGRPGPGRPGSGATRVFSAGPVSTTGALSRSISGISTVAVENASEEEIE